MKKIIIIVIILGALLIGWYLVSPLFLDKEINEDLPFDLSELQENSQMPESMSLDAMDALLDMPGEEEIEAMSDEEKQAMEEKMQNMVDQMPPVVAEEEMPEQSSGPTLLKQGNFRDADDFHKGSGIAKLVALEDGSNLLRLEDFNVTNGPDLFVYLTKNGNPQDSDDVHEGFYDLGRLKGNIGNQNYVIPAGVDVSEYNSVIIYCRAFSVLFTVASF